MLSMKSENGATPRAVQQHSLLEAGGGGGGGGLRERETRTRKLYFTRIVVLVQSISIS